MVGGDGNDTYSVDDAKDMIVERADEGIDLVNASVDHTLAANVDNLTLLGAAVTGRGNTLDNIITGNANNNIIDGGRGADVMTGLEGDDTFYVDDASDVVDGGDDEDTIVTSISFDLADATDVENLTASANNLTLTGDGAANVMTSFDSASGKTTLIGGGGDDTYYLNGKNDVIIDSAGADDTAYINYASGVIGRDELTARFAGIEVFLTDNAKLTIVDNVGDRTDNGDTIGAPAAGDQTIDGGSSRNTILAGGDDDDTYFVRHVSQTVSEALGEGDDTVITSLSGYTLTANVENLELDGRTRAGNGNALDNSIIGNDGANVIDGGAGEDYMEGGKGNDTYYVDDAGDQVFEVGGEGTDKVIASVNYSMAAEVENLDLTGTAFNGLGNALNNIIRGTVKTVNYNLNAGGGNDTIYGNDGDDLMNGGIGNDRMYGGKGNDTYYVDSLNDVVVDTSGTADRVILDATLGGVGTYRLAAGIELLTLDNANAGLNVIGNSSANSIGGGNGADTIDGGAGNDTISSGAGDDLVYGGAGHDQITTGLGIDEVYGGAGDDVINAGDNDDTVYGEAGNDEIYGDNGNDFIDGGSGNDYLEGNAGDDTIYGGSGNDTIDGGDDNDTLYGDAGNDNIDAGAGNDTVYGGAGNDSILGGDGADTLYGDAGNDIINGGLGDDIIYGGAGNDLLTGGDGNDVFVFARSGGVDTITDFTTGDDVIDINDVMVDFGTGMIADIARFIDNADGHAQLQISNRGTGTGWQTIAVLDGVASADLDINTDIAPLIF